MSGLIRTCVQVVIVLRKQIYIMQNKAVITVVFTGLLKAYIEQEPSVEWYIFILSSNIVT
jgi:hypothetical protein